MICKPGLILMLVAAVTVSCSDYGPSHDLIKLAGLRPNLVESGDKLQIVGSGFAEGSSARISFRGDIYRPGEAPRRDVEIVVRTKDTSKEAVTFAVNEELEQAFCGPGADASHAAFRGTITLAFSAGSDLLAPVTGVLRGVNLEIMPKGRSTKVARERQQLSQQALSFMGLELIDQGASDCCTVLSTRGRALLAGIKAGDRLMQFDGVPVRAPTDLIPTGRNRTSSVWVRREDAAHPVLRSIDVQGFRWSIPSELATAFGALLLAFGFLLGLNSNIRRLCSSLAARAAQLLPSSSAGCSPHARFNIIKSGLVDLPLPDHATLRIAQAFSVISLGAFCAALSLRQELVSGELDLALWWLAMSIAVSVANLIAQVIHTRRGSLGSLLVAFRTLAHQIPLLVVIVLAALAARSARISEIVRVQGFWPNSWFIFHDPAFALASILAMGALIPLSEGVAFSSPADGNGTSAAVLLRFLIVRVHLWIQSVLLAILLFGGWAATPEQGGEKHGIWFLVPALVLLTKTWCIISFSSFARVMFRSLTYRYTTPWVVRVILPASLLCGLLSTLWTWGIHRWSLPWAGTSLRWFMLGIFFVLLCTLVLQVQRRVRGVTRAPLENHWT